jgi:plastocyanin
MTSARPIGLAAGFILALGAVSGCSSSADKGGHSAQTRPSASVTQPSSSPSGNAAPAKAMIMIKSFAYTGTTKVAPGTTVTVMNADSEAHTVTADTGGAFDVKIDPGASATFTAPSKPGTYPYPCSYHATMHGVLRVG